jgi:AraC family transcriptional regulator of arabinose operon
MLPISPTPAPHSHPIISGIQYQGVESRGWRPEGTRDWLLVTTLQGIGYAKTSKGSCQVRPGDMLLIAPGTPQEYGHYDESSDWVNIWAHFEPRLHWLAWLAWPQIARGVMVLSAGGKFPEIEAELRRMVEISRGPLRLRQDAAMNSLERALIAADDVNPLHAVSGFDVRIRKALEIVGERLGEPIRIETLSRAVGLSRSRFSVLFADELNVSPQTYIELARLGRAAQMLQSSSWSVSQIAEEVGFTNAYYFSTRFRRQYGMPPSTYRLRSEMAANATA